MTSPGGMSQIRVLGGAMSRVSPDATAFAHRDKPIMFSIVTSWPDGTEGAAHEAWVERYWSAISSHASGAYVNFLADDGADRIGDAYPPATYRRLQAIKRRYDPTNVFHLNQNIPAFDEEAHAAEAA
jgi:FAD/FMN-containing dehydrogenase